MDFLHLKKRKIYNQKFQKRLARIYYIIDEWFFQQIHTKSKNKNVKEQRKILQQFYLAKNVNISPKTRDKMTENSYKNLPTDISPVIDIRNCCQTPSVNYETYRHPQPTHFQRKNILFMQK